MRMSSSQHEHEVTSANEPTKAQIRRWQRYLADEIAEGQIYRDLAGRSKKPERDILLGLADAEDRHAQHWRDLLGPHAQVRSRPSCTEPCCGSWHGFSVQCSCWP